MDLEFDSVYQQCFPHTLSCEKVTIIVLGFASVWYKICDFICMVQFILLLVVVECHAPTVCISAARGVLLC